MVAHTQYDERNADNNYRVLGLQKSLAAGKQKSLAVEVGLCQALKKEQNAWHLLRYTVKEEGRRAGGPRRELQE